MAFIWNHIWHESFWLPEGYSWEDMANKPGSRIYLPQREDMLWSVCGGLVLLVFRFFMEYFITTPLGYKLGVKLKKKPILKPNQVLEEEYLKNGLVSNNNLESVSKRTDMSVREVERWLRDRQIISKPSDIQRFNECCWHFVFYSTSFTFGLVVLWNKPWLWETILCWKNWPLLDVSPDVYWYYMIELSFYWSLVYSMLTDHKRKDFNQMIVHHICTILLVFFSWANNFVRIGTLVLITHDIADIPMAFAKMMKYCGRKTLTDVFFVVFFVVWVLSRLAFYPFIVLYSSMIESHGSLNPFPSYYFFNGLLAVLQILHIIWTYMIAKIAARKIFYGKIKDIRSDSESDK